MYKSYSPDEWKLLKKFSGNRLTRIDSTGAFRKNEDYKICYKIDSKLVEVNKTKGLIKNLLTGEVISLKE